MSHCILLPLLAFLPLTVLARGSTHRDPVLPPAPLSAGVDRNRLYFDVEADGTLWARGRTWKASFASDGATYIPFLGSDAPRNHPVSLHVESVTIGGEPIEFDRDVPAVRNGDAIEYERGAFRERYILGADSVEQTFEFDALPRRGEIVVSLSIATDLTRAADAEGFRFESALGHVRYGKAFARHDQGELTPIESRLSSAGIDLVAPAGLVERAVGRFVIDPVLTTWVVQDLALDELAADTAWDNTNNVWLTVFEEVFSASDHDIRAVRHSSAGVESAAEYVDTTTADWRDPSVANNNADDQFLVVAARGVVGNRDIVGRTVEATVSLNMSAQKYISDPLQNYDVSAPDVGGDAYSFGPTLYCVVWESEISPGLDYDIQCQRVRTDGTLVLFGNGVIDSSLSIQHNPSVSNLNGSSTDLVRYWNIVWEDEITPTNHNILGFRMGADGVSGDGPFPVASSVLDERNPTATAISANTGGARPWLVAYQVDDGADNWDVRCRSLDGSTLVDTLDLSDQFSTHALDQITPSCDAGGGQFVVAYEERSVPFFGSTDIKVASVFSVGGQLGVNEGNLSASPGLEVDSRPRIVARGGLAGQINDSIVVFDRDDSGPNDIWATGYDIPNGGPISAFCAGDGSGTACPCGNVGAAGHGCASSVNPSGAVLTSTGNALRSNDSLQLTVSGVPMTASVLLFQGSGQAGGGAGTPFGDGLRCAAGVVVRLGTRTAAGGVASYPEGAEPAIANHGGVPAMGGLRFYQGWYRNSASFCTVSTFNLTNGLRVQWVP